MNEHLLPPLKEVFAWDSGPEYFAGGHDWSDGTVFRFQRQGTDRLLKIMRAGSERQLESVQERQAFMEYLNRHGVDTTLPVHSERGNLAEAFHHDGKEYIAYSWVMVPGEHSQLGDPRDCCGFYEYWGKMLGRMHKLAQAWPQWRHSACRNPEGQPLICREWEWRHFYNWFRDDDVRAAWADMKLELDKLPVTRENHGFIHNDAHPGNILFQDGRLILIDFDVANYQWFILDLAICVYSEYSRAVFHSPFAKRKAELDTIFITPFMTAYESENNLPREEYGHIELFLNYRRFLMFACFYDQIRKGNPAYLERMKQDIIGGKAYLPEDNYFARNSG
jgi:Ser/Thr protein kinase RdoA (MazF antagonist)